MSNATTDRTQTERETNTEQSATDTRGDRDLQAQVELLQAENRRLREEYVRARRSSYRRAAAGLALVGITSAGAGLLFPSVRDVLFVLGAIGLFGGLLTYYLTPERFVAAETGERVYDALAQSAGELTTQLGLQETSVYVPVEGTPPARVFVPQHQEYQVPEGDTLERPLVVDADEAVRGAAFVPTGATLFREFERTLTGSLAETPTRVVDQVADALVEGFELAESVETDVNPDEGRASVEFTGAVYGDATRFDNPLGSLVAVALARGLDTPVTIETTPGRDDEFTVTCRWDVTTE